MYRSVMVPLDGSAFGEQALQVATRLAQRTGARLELVHVHNANPEVVEWEPVTPFRFEGLEQSEREWDGSAITSEQNYLSTQAQQLARAVNRTATCKVLSGPVVAALEQEIVESDPDLIAMATHGRGGFSRAWLGSVADELVRRIHKPLLLVRASTDDKPASPSKLENILITLDGSELAESIVAHALRLGEGAAATYTLLQVVHPAWSQPEIMSEPDPLSHTALQDRMATAREYLARVADSMSAQTLNVKMDVVVGTAAGATVLDYARDANVDVIAMATHGRGGVKRMLLGSVADKVLRAASVPVLVFRP